MGAAGRPNRSDHPARGAGGRPRAGARPDPLWADVGFAVCLLSGCGIRDGRGFVAHAANRHSGSALRDAHLANFGGFASAERQLLFDLNDFDESLPGPWEWDVKRLAASVAIAGRDNAFPLHKRQKIVRRLVGAYREAIRQFAAMSNLDVWYARASFEDIKKLLHAEANRSQKKRVDETVAKGIRRDSARAYAKLAVNGNGDPRIRSDPPLIVPIGDLVDGPATRQLERAARKLLGRLPTQPGRRSPAAPGALPLRRHGPQGGRSG